MPYFGNNYSFSERFISDANAKGPIADDGTYRVFTVLVWRL